MSLLAILAVLSFSTAVCTIEIPKMLKEKLYRELWAFSVLLVLGTVLAILKSLNVNIPNPSDLIVWIYSPVSGVLKGLFE